MIASHATYRRPSALTTREAPAGVLLLALAGFLAAASPAFRTSGNLLAVGLDAAIIGIMACGEAVVLLIGGLDLSVASTLVLSAGAASLAMMTGWPVLLALMAGVGVGAAAGVLNGALIAGLRLPPIVVTLATYLLYRAALTLLTHSQEIGPLPPGFTRFGLGLWPVALLATVGILFTVLLNGSRVGRWWLALGGNEEASRVSGLPTLRLKLGAYAVSGVCAALAGFLVAASSGALQSKAALGYELDVIAACVIGGVSIRGGQGSIPGAIAGAVLLRLLNNALLLLNVPVDWYRMVIAGILILAALGDRFAAREPNSA